MVLACILHGPRKAWTLGLDLAPHDGPLDALLQRRLKGVAVVYHLCLRQLPTFVGDELCVLCGQAPVLDCPDGLVKVAGSERENPKVVPIHWCQHAV
eukprot:9489666-Pyramimonas_sp.AAC.1